MVNQQPRHAPIQDDEHDDSADPDPYNVQQDTMAPEPQDKEAQLEYENEQARIDEMDDFTNAPMASEEVDERTDGMEPLEKDVSEPGSEGTGLKALPGAAAASAALSVDESADVPALPYDWDMLAMFLTFKMVDTLHNDCAEYISEMSENYPDVYGEEDKENTLRDLPQICTRFPGLRDKVENSNYLFPLSRSVPLVASRVFDLESSKNTKRPPKELAESALSVSRGRTIQEGDKEMNEHDAESRGVDGADMLTGNLFSRSAWLQFTMSAMDKRGMKSIDESDRAEDQGLNVMVKVRNARATSGHADRHVALCGSPMTTHSFTAQERCKRLRIYEEEKALPTMERSDRAKSQAYHNKHYNERRRIQASKKPRNV